MNAEREKNVEKVRDLIKVMDDKGQPYHNRYRAAQEAIARMDAERYLAMREN